MSSKFGFEPHQCSPQKDGYTVVTVPFLPNSSLTTAPVGTAGVDPSITDNTLTRNMFPINFVRNKEKKIEHLKHNQEPPLSIFTSLRDEIFQDNSVSTRN